MWTDDTPDQTVQLLKDLRALRQGTLRTPVTFGLVSGEGGLSPSQVLELRLALQRETSENSSLIRVASQAPQSLGTIIFLDRDLLRIDIFGIPGYTLGTKSIANWSDASLARHILVGIGLAIAKAGVPDLGCRIISEFASGAAMIEKPEVGLEIVKAIAKARRVEAALNLAQQLEADGIGDNLPDFFLFWILRILNQLTDSEKVTVDEFLRKSIQTAEVHGDKLRIALAHYNFANFCRAESPRVALRHLRLAAANDQRTQNGSTGGETSEAFSSRTTDTGAQ